MSISTLSTRSGDPREQAVAALAAAMLQLLRLGTTAPANAPQADRLVTRRTSGLPPKSFDQYVRDGTLPATKIGRAWHVRMSDILALVDRGRGEAPDPEPTDEAADTTTIAGAVARANALRQRRADRAARRLATSAR